MPLDRLDAPEHICGTLRVARPPSHRTGAFCYARMIRGPSAPEWTRQALGPAPLRSQEVPIGTPQRECSGATREVATVPLADRIAQRPDVVHGYPCSVAKLFELLEAPGFEADLAAFETIMYGRPGLRETTRGVRGWNERQVFEVVTDEGYDVAKNQINNHRGKLCRCYRDAT